MKHTAKAATVAIIVVMLAVVSSGCSNDNGKASPTATPTPTTSPTSTGTPVGGATVSVRSSELGQILVDGQGRTLYLFEADTSERSTCSGSCAAAWPPLTTSGTPKAGQGVSADLLGTTIRDDGSTGVTYNGHPLYYYQGDQKPGDTNGQDLLQFGAKWYVLNMAGNKIEDGSDGY